MRLYWPRPIQSGRSCEPFFYSVKRAMRQTRKFQEEIKATQLNKKETPLSPQKEENRKVQRVGGVLRRQP